MKMGGAKKQTLFLTGINAVVRAMGLLLRIILTRFLGAELMGIAELAQSVHMVAIAPLTSGIPVAVSRLTAKAQSEHKTAPLLAGLAIVRVSSFLLIPPLWLLSPWLAQLMGDIRVLPSLWFTAPCVLVLGYSAVYNGYCYGTEQSFIPALSELIEQFMRLFFSFALIRVFHSLTAPWMATVPIAGTLFAEIIGLLFVLFVVTPPKRAGDSLPNGMIRQLLSLSAPSTVTRLIQTFLRSITSVLIPLRLQHSGLPLSESTAQLGILNGMVMPFLMLPCIFTSALAMVSLPKLAKAEEKPRELHRILGLCGAGLIPTGLVCSLGIYLLAPFLSVKVYRQPELTVLFRFCAPLALLFAVSHLLGSVLSALGQQKRAMYASCLISGTTLLLTWLWAADPSLRLKGVIMSQYAGQILSILSSGWLFVRWQKEHYSR